MPAKHSARKLNGVTLVAFSVHFLVLVYLAGLLPPAVWHDLLHSHAHTVEHSAELEKDACHRSIVHNDAEKGCEHQDHFTNGKRCSFDNLATTSAQLVVTREIPSFFKAGTSYQVTGRTLPADAFVSYQPSRAPPTL